MVKKGYNEEYWVKQQLQKKYGKDNVIKVAIGGLFDFIVVTPKQNRIAKIVEVKGCHKKNYTLQGRDKEQVSKIRKFCEKHTIPFELWVKYPGRLEVRE